MQYVHINTKLRGTYRNSRFFNFLNNPPGKLFSLLWDIFNSTKFINVSKQFAVKLVIKLLFRFLKIYI